MNNNPFSFEGKMLDGGKCICDICGKTKKMGGLFEPTSPNPKIVCVDCMVRATAEEHGLTPKEAKRRRERMFASSNLFVKLKMEDYSKLKSKIDSIEEANKALEPIMDFWNNRFTTKQRKSFEKMSNEELEKIYRNIKIDFSDLLEAGEAKFKTKIGRNDPCPCGSGKKYKKCCGNKYGGG